MSYRSRCISAQKSAGSILANRCRSISCGDVRAAFLKWKVVFFRDQHLDHAQHVALARQFGEPTIGHAVFGYVDGHP
jgi:alpha-ketoglutarate-dependent taurine dioxygenase